MGSQRVKTWPNDWAHNIHPQVLVHDLGPGCWHPGGGAWGEDEGAPVFLPRPAVHVRTQGHTWGPAVVWWGRGTCGAVRAVSRGVVREVLLEEASSKPAGVVSAPKHSARLLSPHPVSPPPPCCSWTLRESDAVDTSWLREHVSCPFCCFLVGGILLYSVVLVSATQLHKSGTVVHMSLPLEPPFLLPPSQVIAEPRLGSLCFIATSHGYPFYPWWCIYKYADAAFSIPPILSPTGSTSLFSTSVSSFLPCKQVHQYYYSRIHRYVFIHNVCFSLSDLLHSV